MDAERRKGRNGKKRKKKVPIDAAVSALRLVKNETGQAVSGLHGGVERCSSTLPWKLPGPEMAVTRLTIHLSFFSHACICVYVCASIWTICFHLHANSGGDALGNLSVGGKMVSSHRSMVGATVQAFRVRPLNVRVRECTFETSGRRAPVCFFPFRRKSALCGGSEISVTNAAESHTPTLPH